VREIFSIFGRVFVIILIVSFIEFFVFYRTKIGRLVYVNTYLLLSAFFAIESVIIEGIIGKKEQKILWLSSIPFNRVTEDYALDVKREEVHSHSDNSNNYDLAIYDYPPRSSIDLKDLLHTIIASKNPVDLVTYIEENTERIPLKYVDDLWLLKNIRTYENVYDKIRRIFNFFCSLILLILLLPVAFLFTLIHKIESKGPIFFIQKRVGYEGKEFRLIKFRTMINNAEKTGPRFARINDPRVTKIGKMMRIFRIDEVPQLVNVLKGDMNLIGPRPERMEFIKNLEKGIPFYRLRLEVRPGLTGWAQVNFPYAGDNLNDHIKKLEYDLFYIKNRSLPLDLLILFRTIKTVLSRRGI
jgi:lipopolysaccharide/colanic/teichoic acid biosynthesis glycosyltransferase